ncbi:hypothetical protein K488DRAFT_83348 [Vararia minispora EC-137]|uniref:Uncharacterized protein n=1 Tax=Vararia minispora EC-137 TaxID=1314806 RepID=A0ACB8QU02_9AGAM|nr:hypothetical protein K488DRAFT_83348 [Vararia minispora EC-137]
MYAPFAAALVLAAAVSAVPTKRTVSCTNPGMIANIDRFTLTAFTTDGNGTVTAQYPLSVSPYNYLAVTSTLEGGYPVDNFALQNSSLAVWAAGFEYTYSYSEDITGPSSFLPFEPSFSAWPNGGIYCAQASTSPHGTGLPYSVFLALGSLTDAFSLCHTTTDSVQYVVYDLQQDSIGQSENLDYGSCFGVTIGLTELP